MLRFLALGGVAVFALAGAAAQAKLTPFMEQFSTEHQLKLIRQKVTNTQDWRVENYTFRALSGTVQVSSVVPRTGGQAPTRSQLKYEFVSPRDHAAAIEMIRAFALDDRVNVLTADQLNTCMQVVRTMKAPQVKTMLWRQDAAGRLLKVYCGVTATTEFVVLDDRDMTSAYWKTFRR